jgi:ribosomal protein L16 Arg81 hydroxylase
MIVLLGGQRRYILSHPSECSNLALLPHGRPSERHSAIDFSNPFTAENKKKYPNFFSKAKANEIVLEAGDSLYLPTYWMHYIVSLNNFNYQCNARSGMTHELDHYIKECGF